MNPLGDQILTATNAKRQTINNQMRQLLNYPNHPVDGDKMICLRNYWEDFSVGGDPLINGTIGILKNSFQTWRQIPPIVRSSIKKFDVLTSDLMIPDTNDMYDLVDMDQKMILTGEKCCDWKLSYRLGKLRPRYGDIVPKEFAYAYAITIWKATHKRAMYTAATRASKRLVWVR